MDANKLRGAKNKIKEVLDYLKQHDPKTAAKLEEALADLTQIANDELGGDPAQYFVPW